MNAVLRWICSHWLLATACLLFISCTSARAVVINEIRPWQGTTGEASVYFPASIELHNSDVSDIFLSGWTVQVSRADGSELAFSLPAINLPAQCYLNLLLADTTQDLDFSDCVGWIAMGDDTFGLKPEAGEIGLYNGGGIVDFVGWGIDGSSFGSSYLVAIASGLWPAGEFVELTDFEGFSTLGRAPSGLDNNIPGDWKELQRTLVASSGAHNPIQVEPGDGRRVDSTSTVFRWQQVSGAAGYQLEVDDMPDFNSPVNTTSTADTVVELDLADGYYYWRVLPSLPTNYPAAVWRFLQKTSPLRVETMIYCPQRYQHKDSRLLCIYSNPKEQHNGVWSDNPSRPGCPPYFTTWQGPWDVPHPVGASVPNRPAHATVCTHCNRYCTRASIQMLNARYGGDLTQDEIAYRMFYDWYPNGPEGDLGHHRGAYPAVERPALSWALMGANIGQHIQPANSGLTPIPWADVVSEITNDRPIMFCGDGHTRVLNGFDELVDQDGDTTRWIHFVDPWPGNTGWYQHEAVHCDHYHTLPADVQAGRDTDVNVSTDNDGDGVMNFDEGITTHDGIPPRDFCSNPNILDTDKDELPDKIDIHVYTFCDFGPCPENDPLSYPDIDNDVKRGECDCDSDNDADFDGGEEITGDGWNPLDPWETCAYDNTVNEMWVNVLLVPGPVLCTEIAFLFGNSFHEISTYPYELIVGCPDPDSGEGITWTGHITSTPTGFLPLTFIGIFNPGIYRARVDVLKDHLYSEPSNWDPWTCFQVPPHVRIVVPPFVPPVIPPFYESALATLGISYVITPIPLGSDGPTPDELDNYFVTIWLTGDGMGDVITPGMASNLMTYLDRGGKLWMTGMNIGEWIYANGIPDPMLDEFYTQRLAAQYIAANAVCNHWSGVPGSFLDEFPDVPITGEGGANYDTHSPDEVLPMADAVVAGEWIRDNCQPLPGTLAAVGHEDQALNSRSLYMPFAWESIPDPLLRKSVMSEVLNWLYGTAVAPPPITDLTIQHTPAGLRLNWTPVPGALTYSIYSSSVPEFPLDATTQIGGSEQPYFDIAADPSASKAFYVVTVYSGMPSGGESLSLKDLSGKTDIHQITTKLEQRHIPYRIADGTPVAREMRARAVNQR